MQQNDGLVLWVDEDHEFMQDVIDVDSGDVTSKRQSTKEFCRVLGIRHRPMSEAIKNVVLYERKPKDGNGDAKPVTIGNLGPILLARIEHGQIANRYRAHDIGKPIKLTTETLRQLAAIFGGNGAPARPHKT